MSSLNFTDISCQRSVLQVFVLASVLKRRSKFRASALALGTVGIQQDFGIEKSFETGCDLLLFTMFKGTIYDDPML